IDGAGDQERRQPDRRLIHQQYPRCEHERARERQHLLLTAAHGAGELALSFREPRKGVEAEVAVAVDLWTCLLARRAEQQVFFHSELWKQPAAFRHQCDAEIDNLLSGAADKVELFAVDLRDDAAVLGRTMPITHFISVLLPLPLVPSKTTASPALTLSETSSITRTAP